MPADMAQVARNMLDRGEINLPAYERLAAALQATECYCLDDGVRFVRCDFCDFGGAAPGRAPAPEPTNWQALGRSAVEAAQEVIGQCDCIMAEMSDKDPKHVWYEARDRFLKASGEAPPAVTEPLERLHVDRTA